MLLREKVKTVLGSGFKRWQASKDAEDRASEALALWWRDMREALIGTVDGESSAPEDACEVAAMLGDETLSEDGIEALNAACENFADWFADQSKFAWRHAKSAVDKRDWPIANPRRQHYVDCMDEMQRRASADVALTERRIPLECLLDAIAIEWRYLPSPGAWRTRTQPAKRERIGRDYLAFVEPLLSKPAFKRPRTPACRLVNVLQGSREQAVAIVPIGPRLRIAYWERDEFKPARMPIYDVYDRDDMTTPRLRNATSSQVNWKDENAYVLLVGTRALSRTGVAEEAA